jgi:hypothetical protein
MFLYNVTEKYLIERETFHMDPLQMWDRFSSGGGGRASSPSIAPGSGEEECSNSQKLSRHKQTVSKRALQL